MNIWDFSRFGLSIKSWKLVPVPPAPPLYMEFGILADLDSALSYPRIICVLNKLRLAPSNHNPECVWDWSGHWSHMSNLPTECTPLGCATHCDTCYLRESLTRIRTDLIYHALVALLHNYKYSRIKAHAPKSIYTVVIVITQHTV